MACDATFLLSGDKRAEGCCVEAGRPAVNSWRLRSSETQLAINICGSAGEGEGGGGQGGCNNTAEQTAVFLHQAHFIVLDSCLWNSSKF
jgi:hypothetical protein